MGYCLHNVGFYGLCCWSRRCDGVQRGLCFSDFPRWLWGVLFGFELWCLSSSVFRIQMCNLVSACIIDGVFDMICWFLSVNDQSIFVDINFNEWFYGFSMYYSYNYCISFKFRYFLLFNCFIFCFKLMYLDVIFFLF